MQFLYLLSARACSGQTLGFVSVFVCVCVCARLCAALLGPPCAPLHWYVGGACAPLGALCTTSRLAQHKNTLYSDIHNVYRQEEKEREEEQGAGEDRCHPSAYNKKTASYAVSLISGLPKG